jgi:hypothetical protein
MPRVSFRGATTVLAVTTAALIATGGAAFACHGSDDGRGTPVPHPNPPTTCVEAGQGGSQLTEDNDYKVTSTNGGRWIDVAANKGVTVKAIVVSGGNDGFYVYKPGKSGLSDSGPWQHLRAPFSRGGNEDTHVGKVLLCGSKEETKPPAETTTSKPKPTETAKPTETTSAPSSTETTTVVPAGNESGGSGGGLANTGFSNTWLIGVAALLLLAGGGLLTLLRIRRKAGN